MKNRQQLAVMVLLASVISASGNSRAGWLERRSPPVPAPALNLTDTRGVAHSLEDLSGHVVLVNFWATWCSPCLDEMPSIIRLQKRVGDDSLVILGVSVDEPIGRVRLLGKRLGIGFPLLVDPGGGAFQAWKVRGYPSSFLVDGEGRIRFQAIGPIEWDDEESIAAVNQLIEEAAVGPRKDVR